MPVEALDTTGAGDTFNGVLAAALAAGLGLEEAAHRAVLAASASVSARGARGGMPRRSELDRLARAAMRG
jgi:ribokinase